jgi:hypothetical protein
VGQDQQEDELVEYLPGYRMECFRQLSDEIWLSSSQYTLCFFPSYWSFSLNEQHFFGRSGYTETPIFFPEVTQAHTRGDDVGWGTGRDLPGSASVMTHGSNIWRNGERVLWSLDGRHS